MNIFIDLDDTLFNTTKLTSDSAKQVSDGLHVEESIYYDALTEHFKSNDGVYSPNEHARITAKLAKLPEGSVLAFFETMFLNEPSLKYVFEGVYVFLNECNNIGVTKILTLGEDENQTNRAVKSEITEHVNEVIVTQHDKGETIKDLGIEVGKIVLVDDSEKHLNAVKSIYPDSLTLHAVWNTKKTTESECHIRVDSFTETIKQMLAYRAR